MTRVLRLFPLYGRTIALVTFVFLAVCLYFELIARPVFSKGEYSGVQTHLTLYPYISIFGMLLLGAKGEIGKLLLLPSYPEFVLTRPISRARAFAAQSILFFGALLIPFVLACSLLLVFQPDLHFSLYHSATQHTSAYEKLEEYRRAFPESIVVPGSTRGHETLVVKGASSLLGIWHLYMAAVFALAMQATALFCRTRKSQLIAIPLVLGLPIA